VRRYAEKRGLDVVLGHPAHIGESVAAGVIGIDDEVIALGFPDSIWEPIEGFALLRNSLTAEIHIVLDLFDFPDSRRPTHCPLPLRVEVRRLL